MNYDDLPKEVKKQYDSVKYSSWSLQTEVEQALDEADNLDDFIERVEDKMEYVMSEAKDIAGLFSKVAKQHRKSEIIKNLKKVCGDSIL